MQGGMLSVDEGRSRAIVIAEVFAFVEVPLGSCIRASVHVFADVDVVAAVVVLHVCN